MALLLLGLLTAARRGQHEAKRKVDRREFHVGSTKLSHETEKRKKQAAGLLPRRARQIAMSLGARAGESPRTCRDHDSRVASEPGSYRKYPAAGHEPGRESRSAGEKKRLFAQGRTADD